MKKIVILFLAFVLCMGESYSQELNFATAMIPKLNISNLFDFSFNPTKLIEARGGFRGGGFRGGSRGGSFGGRRSSGGLFRSSKSGSKPSSFGGTKSSNVRKSTGSSFGGSRMMTSQAARAKYGTPRKSTPMTKYENGRNVNYNVHDYGGFSSGLMTGYMMGHMSWWMHGPAFFYSRPVYVYNTDGSYDVYPPTFNFGKLLMTLIIIGLIVLVIRAIIKNKRSGGYSSGSFS